MVHLTVHLVREVKLCGPVWYRWMYPFERFMKILKGYVRNRHRPEGCIAECYVAEEAVEYCSQYLSSMHTVGIPSTSRESELNKPLSRPTVKAITEEEKEQVHRYVLINDADIDPYIEEHKAQLRRLFPKDAKNLQWLENKHNKEFVGWIHDYAKKTKQQLPERLHMLFWGPTKQVLEYSSYLIGGVIFHTTKHDETRVVQNSGVNMHADIMQVSSSKDKNPIVADMLFYGRIEEIWELDYTTFRVVVFKCSWVDNNNGVRIDENGFTLVNLKKTGYKSDPFILGSQANQVFYIEDPEDQAWSVAIVNPNKRQSEIINRDDLGDISIQLQSFSKGLPIVNTNEAFDENEPPCFREDCDGIWVNNADQ